MRGDVEADAKLLPYRLNRYSLSAVAAAANGGGFGDYDVEQCADIVVRSAHTICSR